MQSEIRHVFIQKIHWANLPYAWILSLFYSIHYASAALPSSWLSRFNPVQWEDTLTYDDWIRIRDEAWDEWKRIVPALPASRWRLYLFGFSVDYHRIAFQHLGIDYLAHRRLESFIEGKKLTSQAVVADSVSLRYLQSCGEDVLSLGRKLGVSRAGWLWDFIYVWGRNVGWLAVLFLQAVSALKKGSNGPIDILHEGLSASESGAGPAELSFSWITSRHICSENRILFVLAGHQKTSAANILSRHELLKGLGIKVAIQTIRMGIRHLIGGIISVFRAETVWLTQFALRSIPPGILVSARYVRTYLTTNSACSPEHPSICLYNAMKVRTVLWAYGANMALFNHQYLSKERHFYTAHMETKECWLWSEHHCALWRAGEILSAGPEYHLLGPAMMGDARPCLMSSSECRRRYLNLRGVAEKPWRNVVVFDMNPVNKAGQQTLQLGPLVVTEDLVDAFYRDLIKLLDAFPDIRLLVKTKRREHPHKARPKAQQELLDPSRQWVRTGRVLNLDPEINPYIPVGSADLGVGLPFSSPILACLHFGRPALYHDPLGTALEHHYHDLDAFTSHGYEELERQMRWWLYQLSDQEICEYLNKPEVRRFGGPYADPAEAFGKALWGEEFSLNEWP